MNTHCTEDFSPYDFNGGSIVAIAGDDFVVIAADTRLISGNTIQSRDQSKFFPMSAQTVLASTGCWCDCLSLTGVVKVRMQMYQLTHGKTMSTDALAQMLSIMMYKRRFFPYLVSNILAGLDSNGKGAIYSYDPIGHCERATYQAVGAAESLMQPILDNQFGIQHQKSSADQLAPFTKELAVAVATDTFISAAERHIHTGDSVEINIITKNGIAVETLKLRKD